MDVIESWFNSITLSTAYFLFGVQVECDVMVKGNEPSGSTVGLLLVFLEGGYLYWRARKRPVFVILRFYDPDVRPQMWWCTSV